SLVAAALADVRLVDVCASGADLVVGRLLIHRALDDQRALADPGRVLQAEVAHDVQRRGDVDAVRKGHVAAAQRNAAAGVAREDVVPGRVVQRLGGDGNHGNGGSEGLLVVGATVRIADVAGREQIPVRGARGGV